MKAVVVGAGIAGPVLGIGLKCAGFEPVVLESHSEASTSAAGAWLTLAINGLAALATFDLDQRVLDIGFPSQEIELFNASGRKLGIASLGKALPDSTCTQTLKRSELHRTLVEGARAKGIEIAYGRKVTHVVPRSDGSATVRVDDGTEIHAQVVIGADGAHSRVRRMIDPGAPEPRLTRMGNVGGFVPAAAARKVLSDTQDPGTYRMIFGRRAFFGYVLTPQGEVWWFANPPTPYPSQCDANWLADLFSTDCGPACGLILATPSPLTFALQYELSRVSVWHKGCVGILGDAAHAASPTSGQGASLAIEDAVALSRCLRDLPVDAAWKSFEQQRRARVERVVKEAARTSSTKIPGPLGAWMRDLMLPYFLSAATRASRDWLFDHRIPWTSHLVAPTTTSLT